MQLRNPTIEHGAYGGARTCLSEASPAAQCEELRFLLHRSVQRVLFWFVFSFKRKELFRHILNIWQLHQLTEAIELTGILA